MVVNNSVEKDRKKIRNSSNGIFLDYPNVNGLDNVFESIWNISESKGFKDLIKNIERLRNYFADSNYFVLHAPDSFIDEVPQIKYSKDVFLPNRLYYIIPRKFKGEIVIDDYAGLVEIVFLVSAFNDMEITPSNIYRLAHKIMVLLNDFDKNIDFNEPDKQYFLKLKNVKWNNNAKKLLNKIDGIYNEYRITSSDEVFDENPDLGYPVVMGVFAAISWKALILLCGCNAINNGRNVMNCDDVVCALQTYFKLLDLLNNNYK